METTRGTYVRITSRVLLFINRYNYSDADALQNLKALPVLPAQTFKKESVQHW